VRKDERKAGESLGVVRCLYCPISVGERQAERKCYFRNGTWSLAKPLSLLIHWRSCEDMASSVWCAMSCISLAASIFARTTSSPSPSIRRLHWLLCLLWSFAAYLLIDRWSLIWTKFRKNNLFIMSISCYILLSSIKEPILQVHIRHYTPLIEQWSMTFPEAE